MKERERERKKTMQKTFKTNKNFDSKLEKNTLKLLKERKKGREKEGEEDKTPPGECFIYLNIKT